MLRQPMGFDYIISALTHLAVHRVIQFTCVYGKVQFERVVAM